MSGAGALLAAITACLAVLAFLGFGYHVVVYTLMGVALASVSYVVYYKRLEFLAAGSTHAALLAVALGVVLEYYTGVSYYLAAVPVGLLVVYAAGALVRLGLDPGKASATIISASSALAVIATYYALRLVPGRVSLSALVLGDPLLLTREEALFGAVVSIATLLAILSVRVVVVETSVDEVSTRLAGVNTLLYDFAVYTIIGIATIAMLRFAGYVMEHVFLLLPATAAARFSRSSKDHLVQTMTVGAVSAMLGYVVSYTVGLAPTGVTGLMLIGMLVAGYAGGWSPWRGRRGLG